MRIVNNGYFGALTDEAFRYISASEGAPLFIIVPSSSSFLMEKLLTERIYERGFLGTEVLSPEKLTERVLSAGGSRRDDVIDRTGLVMMTKRALGLCRGELSVFADTRDASLPEKLSELITSLKNEGITAGALADMAGSVQGSAGTKLHDVAIIYKYLDIVKDGRPDRADMAVFASSMAPPYFAGSNVLIHGFDVFSKSMADTVAAIASSAADVLITLELEEGDPVYEKQARYRDMIAAAAKQAGVNVGFSRSQDAPLKNGDVSYLFNNIYKYKYKPYSGKPCGFSAAILPDRTSEVKAAAERILCAVDGGLKPSDIFVLVGNKADYEGRINDVFGDSDISFFLEDKRTLFESRAAVFALSAIDIVSGGWSLDDVLRHLNTGYLNVSEDEADALSDFIREKGLYGSAMRKPLREDAPEGLEDIRKRAFERLSAEKRDGFNAAALAKYIADTGLEQAVADEADELAAAGLLKESAFALQTYEKLSAVLTQAAAADSGETGAELSATLTFGMKSVNISVVPPAGDQVIIGDITHSIFPRKKLMIILGMNDGMIPFIPDTAGLINAGEMASVKELCPSFPDKLTFFDQKLYIRRAIGGGDELFITCNEADGGPSYLLKKAVRILGANIEERHSVTPPARRAALTRAAQAMRSYADGDADADLSLAASYKGDDDFAALAARLDYDNSARDLGGELAKRLYGRLKGSASMFEQYYTCPYKHFITYGLRPAEKREFDEDARSAGVYAHTMLDRLRRELPNWGSATDAEIDSAVENISGELRADHNNGIFTTKRYAMTEKHLKEKIAFAAKAVRSQLSDGARILRTEQRFGGDTFTVRTPAGDAEITGVIDRIDGIDSGKYVSIVDYKSGEKKFDEKEFAMGLELQLLIYLEAALSMYSAQGAKPGGAFYFSIKTPDLDEGKSEEERISDMKITGFSADAEEAVDHSRNMGLSISFKKDGGLAQKSAPVLSGGDIEGHIAVAKKLCEDAVMAIYGGSIAIKPADVKDICKQCGYSSICRFDGKQLEGGDEE